MYASHSEIVSFASSREISNEIAEAILELATSESDAQEIWAEPTDEQRATVISRAWDLADADEDELVWGGSLSRNG
ncbi:hypothetical protein HK19_01085 [Acetobacter persici]|uniref:YccJ family protein n=1 Tax=Acetobacter persici TaxID=1076596 RepID=UPI000A3A6C76|nr:YccJ family protein [Acetobacter persici]OUI92551.1 hypothetical protein HK19_01085 [Acetobacter persici]